MRRCPRWTRRPCANVENCHRSPLRARPDAGGLRICLPGAQCDIGGRDVLFDAQKTLSSLRYTRKRIQLTHPLVFWRSSPQEPRWSTACALTRRTRSVLARTCGLVRVLIGVAGRDGKRRSGQEYPHISRETKSERGSPGHPTCVRRWSTGKAVRDGFQYAHSLAPSKRAACTSGAMTCVIVTQALVTCARALTQVPVPVTQFSTKIVAAFAVPCRQAHHTCALSPHLRVVGCWKGPLCSRE